MAENNLPPVPAGYTVMGDNLPTSAPADLPPPPSGYIPGAVINPNSGQTLTAATAEQARQLASNKWDMLKQSVGDSLDTAASFWTTLKANIAPDVQKQINIYANARGISPDRYGVADGQIVYFDPMDNRLKREVPSVGGASGPLDAFQRVGRHVAAETPSMVPQIAGGAAALPFGPVGGPVAAGTVATATDAGRQVVGNWLADTPLSDISYGNALGQGAGALVGTAAANGVGALARKAYDTNPLKAAGFDAAKLTDPANQAEWSRIASDAQARGITLFPGDLTGAKSLLAQQRQLSRYPESTDIFADAVARRAKVEIPKAAASEFDKISPQASPALGARQFQQGAQDTLAALNDARNAAAKPFYTSADSQVVGQDVAQGVLDHIDGRLAAGVDGPAADALRKAKQLLFAKNPDGSVMTTNVGGKDVPVLKTNVGHLDYVKKQLDDMMERSADSVLGRNGVSEINDVKSALLSGLDTAAPDYAKARAAYASGSPAVTQAENGLTGLIAKETPYPSRVTQILGQGDPLSISSARNDFLKVGQGDAWNAGVRAHLENVFQDAAKVNANGEPGNVAGKFYSNLFGDDRKIANIKAAIGDDTKFASLQSFMDVMKSAARTLPEGSATATDLGAKDRLAGPLAKIFGRSMQGISPNLMENMGDALINYSSGKNAAALARLYTNGNAMETLAKMRMMSPQSENYWKNATKILEGVGYIGVNENYNRPAEQMPRNLGGR